jgi:HlyD family secretion protein
MKKKGIWIAVAVIAVLGIGSFLAFRPKEQKAKYKTEKVTRGNIQESVFASGTINPITSVSVGCQVSGRIKEIYADFNSEVKQGQLIAEIDPASYQAQVDQARANKLLAAANLQKAEAALLDAKRNFDRATELFQRSLIAQSDRDSAETAYLSAKAAVEAAKAQLVQASAALSQAETNLLYTRIISPVNGIVISRNVNVGQTVVASFQSPTLFLIAQDLTKMQIDTNVNEADIGKIKAGQSVEFTVDAYPDTTFQGKVSQVRNAPTTVSNVVTYDVVIYLDNPELKLKPGMTANATIITADKNNVLRIPNAALRFVPPEEEAKKALQKGYGVWVLKNGKPERVSVKVGISDDAYTELVEGDLKENQELITETTEKIKKANNGPPRMF